MLANFDIFKRNQIDALVWCGAEQTLEAAKSKVKTLMDGTGEFMIFNQKTQESTTIPSEKQSGPGADGKKRA